MAEVTFLLSALDADDPHAAAQLLPLVYDDLRRLAAHRLAHEAPGQTLQPTALVHEAYLRLVGTRGDVPWGGRAHFFAAAAEAMRRILVDQARRRRTLKRGGGRRHEQLDEADGTARA
jgi:RNA polymerase sigma factor (TIGR02999 family)